MRNLHLLFIIFFVLTPVSILYGQSPFIETIYTQEFINPIDGLNNVLASDDNTLFIAATARVDKGPIFFRTPDDTVWRTNGIGDYAFRSNINRSAIYSGSTQLIYSLQDHMFYLTKDTGKTYDTLAHPSSKFHHLIQLFGPNLVVANQFGTFISKDTGRTFQETRNKTIILNNVAYQKDSHIILNAFLFNNTVTTGYGKYSESFDYGETWTNRQYRKPFSVGVHGQHLTDSIIYGLSKKSSFIRWSYDMSYSYPDSIPTPQKNETVLDLVFQTSHIGYILYADNTLFKTYDRGQSWTMKDSFEYPVAQIQLLKNNWVVVNGGEAIYISKNGAEFLAIDDSKNVKETQIHLFPNPNTGVFNIEFDLEKPSPAIVQIFNSNGQLITSISDSYKKGINSEEIRLQGPSGIYHIVFRSGSINSSFSMIKN